MKSVRCAIYTRKSSEEGLEQDFNSLDAQYLACSAYVASQASEGWTLLSQRYDDGGISGGTLERPALQRLLADIAVGRIDIVVVYKVDRLTYIDDKLLKTIATAKQWWQQLVANPQLRIADLAELHQVTESWVTRVMRLAFLDPAIVLQLMVGSALAALDFDALRGPEALPALWSEQRDLHQVNVAR
jgi:hypothetical protein